MDAPEHKFELAKICAAWCGVGGAKYLEKAQHSIDFFMGFSVSDWAAFFALVYSIMQIIMIVPRFFRTVMGWFHAIF